AFSRASLRALFRALLLGLLILGARRSHARSRSSHRRRRDVLDAEIVVGFRLVRRIVHESVEILVAIALVREEARSVIVVGSSGRLLGRIGQGAGVGVVEERADVEILGIVARRRESAVSPRRAFLL